MVCLFAKARNLCGSELNLKSVVSLEVSGKEFRLSGLKASTFSDESLNPILHNCKHANFTIFCVCLRVCVSVCVNVFAHTHVHL